MQTTPTRHRILAGIIILAAAIGAAAIVGAAAAEHQATRARLEHAEKHNAILQMMLTGSLESGERFRSLVLSHCAGDLPQLVAAMQAADAAAAAKAAAAARETAQ